MGVDWYIALQPFHLCVHKALNSWQSLSSLKSCLINSCCSWSGDVNTPYSKQVLGSLYLVGKPDSQHVTVKIQGFHLLFSPAKVFSAAVSCFAFGLVQLFNTERVAWAALQIADLYVIPDWSCRNLAMVLLHKETLPSSFPITSSYREETELAFSFSGWSSFALFFLSVVLV